MQQLALDIQDAATSLKRRPLRSLLSSIGIGIGVAALIAMLSISEGAKQKALAKIESLGTNTLRIENSSSEALRQQQSLANLSLGLTAEDAEAAARWLGRAGLVGAYARVEAVPVASGDRVVTSTLLGVNEHWYEAENLQLAWGRPLHQLDLAGGRNYCLVGAAIAAKLSLASGTTLRVGDQAATVIGALAPRGMLLTEGTGLSSLDFDHIVIMPLSALPYGRTIAGRRILDGLVIALRDSSEQKVMAVAEYVSNQLLERHRQVPDFRLVVPATLLREVKASQRLFALIMGAIAGMSLLVGGIGVMNVLLANISEQTREIGLRMAIGASRRRIVWLYLCNAVLVTISGGAWGLLGGVVLAFAIQAYAGWEVAFSLTGMVLGPLSAVLAGLVFGLHPALRAASLDPAIALRES